MDVMQHNLSEQASDELWELASRYCNDSLDAAGVARLETLLADDPQTRSFFGVYASMHAELTWRFRCGAADASEISEIEALDFPAVEPGDRPIISIFPTPPLSTIHYPLSTDFVGGPVFSYMVATVVLCLMLLGAWAHKITHVGQMVAHDNANPPIHSADGTQFAVVGRVTGMKDCRWVDDNDGTMLGAAVSLNRKYALSSGLLEITYLGGARVTLEGPCEYTADTEAGGFLRVGKLVARVEKKVASGQWLVASKERPETRDRGVKSESLAASHQPPATNNSPLFAIRTPTAVVTDLGTEFGVEVDASGDCWTYVFQGKVELKLTNAGENHRPVRLGENDSVRVIGRNRKVEVTHAQSPTRKFERSIPKRVRLELHNTGVGLQEGDADAHWHIIAMSGDPDFKPRQAVVTATPPYDRWLWNQPRRGQWVSLSNGPDDIPSGTYTFRTTFQLGKDGLNATAISGSFWADNHVDAIRINGRAIQVKEHGYNIPFNEPTPFVIEEGFVEGENTLEFDVFNGGGDNAFPDAPNPMGLRVEMYGVLGDFRKSIGVNQPSRTERNDSRKEVAP